MNPPRSILDRNFRYTPAASTDVAKTFARERARLEFERQQRESQDPEKPLAPVTRIRNR